MHRTPARIAAALVAAGALATGGAGVAAGGHDDDDNGRHPNAKAFHAKLSGYQEVPAISTTGRGSFRARLSGDGTEVRWRLSYRGLETPVQQAHVHFGQEDVNGGVSAFLCGNLPGTPAGVQACPPSPATIAGTIGADDVVGPVEQGIEPRELGELLAAMRAGVTYANVHTDAFPNGEIRGQIGPRKRHR